MIKSYLKTVLIAIGLAMGCVSAWAQNDYTLLESLDFENSANFDANWKIVGGGCF